MTHYYMTTGKSRQAKTLHQRKDCPLLVNARGVKRVGSNELRVWVLCPHCFK